MITIDEIKRKLVGLHFTSYSAVIRTVLDACGVGDTTIKKIENRISEGHLSEPMFVYRQAVLICCDDDCEKTIAQYTDSVPLIIVFSSTDITLISPKNGRETFAYDQLANNTDLLKPLFDNSSVKRDPYATLDLDVLVQSLNRSLRMNDTDADVTRIAIFNLLYIAFCIQVLKIDDIGVIMRQTEMPILNRVKEIFRFFERNNCQFIENNWRRLHLDKEAEGYINGILKFNILQVDPEVLASLIYKMVRNNEVGLFGHQTSFVNVNKVLRPLIFDRFEKAIEKAKNDKELNAIKQEILNTVVFDPTNGPGCYLSAAYNGLQKLLTMVEQKMSFFSPSILHIENFISLTDSPIAEELTKMILMMNHLGALAGGFHGVTFHHINELYSSLNVLHGDILRDDWKNYIHEAEHLYIVGSPKFEGAHTLPPKQKADMQRIFENERLYSADYCSSWLVKSAQLISGTNAKAAFVLTNSVAQGEQAAYIGEAVSKYNCEYSFCYRPFKWNLSETCVTVVIIGIQNKSINQTEEKLIFSEGNPVLQCNEISPLLLPSTFSTAVKKRKVPLVKYLPEMRKGNMPYNADALEFRTKETLQAFLIAYPDAKKFIRPLIGSEEFIKGKQRWCLWIKKENLDEANAIQGVAERIEEVRVKRASSTATDQLKSMPYRFREQFETSKGQISLIVPSVSSENREYIPIGIVDEHIVINNLAFAIYDCEIFMLSLLVSKMHMLWAKQCCGQKDARPRYSNELCYYTFPAPPIDNKQKAILTELSQQLIAVRERFCDRSLGDMYKTMPPELKQIHSLIDRKVDSLYQSKPFESDKERLIHLNSLYNKLIENE